MYYYGLRYYNPWTCRFTNIDPLAGKFPYLTPYQYASNDPIGAIDLDGAESTKEAGGNPRGGNDSTGKSLGYPINPGSGGTVNNVKNSPSSQVKPDLSKGYAAAESKSGSAGKMGIDHKSNVPDTSKTPTNIQAKGQLDNASKSSISAHEPNIAEKVKTTINDPKYDRDPAAVVSRVGYNLVCLLYTSPSPRD